MLTIVHLADLHLGASYSFLSAEKAAIARESQFTVLQHAIDYANSQFANAVLIAGDLFDQPKPPSEIVKRTFSILSQAHCCVLISPGNHDYLCADSPYLTAQRPEQVYVFTSPVLTSFPISDRAVVWGAAFCDQGASIPLDVKLVEDRPNLLLVHSDLKTHSGYNPLTAADLKTSGFLYAALGHNHEYSGMRRAGNTVYACPGSPVSVGTDDTGRKGFLFGQLAEELKFRFIPSGGFECHSYKIDFTTLASDRMLEQALTALVPKNHDKVCASVELVGERSYEPNFPALRQALDAVFLHAQLTDHTTTRRSVWRYLNDDDLRGGVTRSYRAKMDEAVSEEEKSRLMLSLRYALAALDGDALPSFDNNASGNII
ncbi:metallophosphoesterase family protein [Intestinibacillus sp. Marseille-P6563]|uniref:metallophosphoesterase family protein n=1 Tax=Intestinibacillus sp. Marseille-P6563 TaxID=2364792 RepID=UPI000F064281|nr:DNA repair exonuclease [Intestinibacillus sp. Marseille-P6563]